MMFAIHDASASKVFWAGKRRRSPPLTNEGLRSHILDLNNNPPLYSPVGPHIPAEGSGAVIWIGATSGPLIGKVIKVGGNGADRDPGGFYPAINDVWQYDLDANAGDQWTSLADMPAASTDCNLVLLADGKLLVIGGGSRDHEYVEGHPLDAYAVRATHSFDPANPAGGWTQLTPMPSPDRRWYHSTATLLPDGSVLSAGSNNEYNGRIYYPSYYASSRPVVTSVPSTIHYGQGFTISLDGAPTINKVTLLRLGTTTHGFDQGQRCILCTKTQNGSTISVTAPASGGVAPPGYYMLFVVNSSGAPSYARYVKVGV